MLPLFLHGRPHDSVTLQRPHPRDEQRPRTRVIWRYMSEFRAPLPLPLCSRAAPSGLKLRYLLGGEMSIFGVADQKKGLGFASLVE